MNDHNLIQFSGRSRDEVKKVNSKGGKKSGESRRRKKSMKQKLELLLSLPAMDNDKEEFEALGIPEEEWDNEMVILKALFLKAASGDVKAIREIRNLLGNDNAAEELRLRRKDSNRKDKELELKEKKFDNDNW